MQNGFRSGQTHRVFFQITNNGNVPAQYYLEYDLRPGGGSGAVPWTDPVPPGQTVVVEASIAMPTTPVDLAVHLWLALTARAPGHGDAVVDGPREADSGTVIGFGVPNGHIGSVVWS